MVSIREGYLSGVFLRGICQGYSLVVSVRGVCQGYSLGVPVRGICQEYSSDKRYLIKKDNCQRRPEGVSSRKGVEQQKKISIMGLRAGYSTKPDTFFIIKNIIHS